VLQPIGGCGVLVGVAAELTLVADVGEPGVTASPGVGEPEVTASPGVGEPGVAASPGVGEPGVAASGPIGRPDSLAARLSQDLDGVFAEVVTTFEGPVFTTALRLTGRADEAEDLAAETFLRAYAGLRRYPPVRIADLQLRPWLVTICLNQWRNQVRTARRRPLLEAAPGSSSPEPSSAGESPEDRVERLDQAGSLAAALQQLPTKQRIAVVLRHIVGLPYAEVAEALACPEGTAKSHVSRGLDQLRVLLPHVAESVDPLDRADALDKADALDRADALDKSDALDKADPDDKEVLP
jgi:RNA polymerase sigma-70 factor (ECF subfamily)